MKTQKVFCIGWHKTGTTTLGDALLKLGYKVLGARLDLAEKLQAGKLDEVLDEAQDYDALQDVPWNALFKQLDKRFPDSKFVLTIRDERKWILSATKHFGKAYSPMREWLYGVGVLSGSENIYLERYKRHYAEVLEYFKDRPSDLLIMDLEQGDGWEKLCAFLDHRIPYEKFPHSNKAKHSFTAKDRILDYLRNLVPLPIRLLRMKFLKFFGVPDPRHRFNNRVQNEQVRSLLRNSTKHEKN